MPLTQTFIINGQVFGTSSFPRPFPGPNTKPLWSALFYCRDCGKVYGFCPITTDRGEVIPFQAYRGCCEQCTSSYAFMTPGSIWNSWDDLFLDNLPHSVLLREFNLLLSHKLLLERID